MIDRGDGPGSISGTLTQGFPIAHHPSMIAQESRSRRRNLRKTRVKARQGSRSRPAQGNGFNLVDLAVVVVVIGFLTGFGVPRFVKAVERSRATEAFDYLTSVRAAQDRYQAENGDVRRQDRRARRPILAAEVFLGSRDLSSWPERRSGGGLVVADPDEVRPLDRSR